MAALEPAKVGKNEAPETTADKVFAISEECILL